MNIHAIQGLTAVATATAKGGRQKLLPHQIKLLFDRWKDQGQRMELQLMSQVNMACDEATLNKLKSTQQV